MTSPILCAVDFSPDSRAALLWACGQAQLTKTPLLLLHIVHDPASSPGFYRKLDSDWLRPMSEVAEEMMADFLNQMRADNPDVSQLRSLEVKLVPGLPPGRIVEVARQISASLVVVGSRGRTGLPHILLGSVAERVAQTAPMPVVVVKAPAEAAG
jgi:nucleotide-binding universal stress UspA family protein